MITVTNRSTTAEHVGYGGCWAAIRLFVTSQRVGTPGFDSGAGNPACSLFRNQLTIAPGDSGQLVGYYEVASIVAAGVAPGRYFVTLVVAPNGIETSVLGGDMATRSHQKG